MKRPAVLVGGAIWVVAMIGAVVLFATGAVRDLTHAYCAAWLLLVSLPLGALPILMVLDLLDLGETSVSGSLRLLLASLPILAVLLVPILVGYDRLHPHELAATAGFHARWFSREAFTIRTVVYLVLWVGLALFFVRPEPPRRAIAGIGLAIHMVIGTLAAYDWFMALDAGFNSSAYGVLMIAAQGALALTAAAIISLAGDRGAGPGRDAVLAVVVIVAIATFVQFVEYLVIWSANLPKEIVWYQTRASDAVGPIFSIVAPLVLALAAVVLLAWVVPLSDFLRSRRKPLAAALVAMLVVEVADVLLLASPGRAFTIAPLILACLIAVGIAGLAGVCASVVSGRLSHGARHG